MISSLFEKSPLPRVTTALLLALAVSRYAAHYELLDFAFAPSLAAVFVAVGYLLISRRYETSLAAVILGLAAFLAFKSPSWRSAEAPPRPEGEVIRDRLALVTALVLQEEAIAGARLSALSEIRHPPDFLKDGEWRLCPSPCDGAPASHARFWIVHRPQSAGDKPGAAWYVSDSFETFTE